MRAILAALLALSLSLLSSPAVAAPPAPAPAPVLPMAVWYGGGKARAPMLEARSRVEDARRGGAT